MARIDSILSIVTLQGANELRVGTDREPKVLAHGAPKRLSMPVTAEDTLRELLGDILTAEREETMRAKGRVDVAYDAGGLGSYQVTLTARPGSGFDAVFVRGAPRAAASPSPSVPKPPAAAPVAAAPVAEAVRESEAPARAMDATIDASGALARLVARAAGMGASDLHFADGESPTVRVDGDLVRLDDEAGVDVASVVGLDAASLARIERGHALDLAADFEDSGRVRVHVYRAEEGLVAAVRLLPRAAPSLASLHMPMPLDFIVDLPHGLVLVCGATGAGKSTTLAALAQEAIRRKAIVLTTLEDPIEYALAPGASLVRRRQIGRHVRDFAGGLRDALREDPDLMLVGEMRDPETIGLALTAAETGHLVLASMHSRGVASAVERIVDSYPPERQGQIRVQLADSLRVVVAQWLLPRAKGSGRIPAIEVLRVNHAVASLIREGKTAQIATALQSGRREGMLALERCLADLVQGGEIRQADARAVAGDSASLATYLAGRPA